MAEPIPFKYRAFLSYSHADTRLARRLHRRLEAFRIDKDLIGRPTAHGAVPATLRPIFRDRDDFTAGHTLTDQTIAALDASAALIVLCSPASAKSHYVNEEIRLFKARHPERPVIPVIVDGTPGDPERECFAPALRFKVAADGTVTETPDDELAADVRERGDGFDLAVAKVVARLLDLATDDVFRRAERARRRSATIRNAIIGALALLAVAAMGSAAYAWQQLKTNEAFLEATLRRATEIVNTAVAQAEKYSVPRTATLELLSRAEGLFDDMARLGRPTPALQRQKAWMLIEFARNYEILGDTTKQRERAEEAHRITMTLAVDSGDETALNDLAATHSARGDVLVAQGNLLEALKSYQASVVLRERLTKADPRWARNLAVTYSKLGNVFVAQGNLSEALKFYEASRGIRGILVANDPQNVDLQRDLSIGYSKMGDVLVNQGNLSDALAAYETSLDIDKRLAEVSPDHAGWQHGLSITFSKVGDVFVAHGKLLDAMRSYHAGLAIRERLVKADPSNTRWQSDLSASHGNVGDVFLAHGDLSDALDSYETSHAIADKLAKTDVTNATWQLDLSISHERIGDVLVAQKKQRDALESYQAGLAIRERLAKSDPANSQWQYGLAASHQKVGDVLVAGGNLDDALKSYRTSHDIIDRLVANDSNNADWRRGLSVTYEKIGDIFLIRKHLADALKSYQTALAIRDRMARDDPSNSGWQADLAANYGKLGQVYAALGDNAEALRLFKAGRAIVAPHAASSGHHTWIRYLRGFDAFIARLEQGSAAK
jgi:tetratricopeptide (TPR) repeat protein